MAVREQIAEGIKTTLRAGDKKRLSVLRMLLAELKVADASGKEFDELAVVRSYAKRLRKACEEYKNLNLAGRAEEIQLELAIVEEFLPRLMDAAELEQLVDQLIADNNWGPRDLGRVMKAVMSLHGERVDGQLVQQIARQKLAERG